MTRLFLRTFYIVFLWIILLANLIFVFDLGQIVGSYTTFNSGDLSNKYLGVSTIINMLKNLDELPLGKFTSSMGSFQKDLFRNGAGLLDNLEWPNLAEAKNFLDGVIEIFKGIASIGKIIASLFVYLFGILMTIIYYIMLTLNFVFTIFAFFNGYNVSEVPRHIWEEGNFITPLFTAV